MHGGELTEKRGRMGPAGRILGRAGPKPGKHARTHCTPSPKSPGGEAGSNTAPALASAYRMLRARNGHLGWWPGRTPIEVITGAILAQNTAWTNVERAIDNLRAARVLSVAGLRRASLPQLEAAVRPSGYFRQKARKLKAFITLLDREHSGSLAHMRRTPSAALRAQLLATWGIGPETADSILLYAFERPVFVVDAYTLRVATRHRWVAARTGYADLQTFFTRRLPNDVDLFNDYHAQIVWVGKHYCRTRPKCAECPLRGLLPRRRAARAPR
jgi:endonuclease-3 related protein